MTVDQLARARNIEFMIRTETAERPWRTRAAFVVMGSSASVIAPVVIAFKTVSSIGHIAGASLKALQLASPSHTLDKKAALKDHMVKAWGDIKNLLDCPTRSVALLAAVVTPRAYTITELALARLGLTSVDLENLQKAESDMFNMIRYVTGDGHEEVKEEIT